MKYALVDGKKTAPMPGLHGICNCCGSEMVAKCGRVKAWHWAHKSRTNCDPWWETEGEWHREWKDQFPEEWQEVVHVDEITGERHIADIKTPSGLVIEFQHSPIKPEEMQSREQFYQNMIWVVDTDRDSVAAYFNMGLSMEPIGLDPVYFQLEWWGRSRFLHNWGEATVPVFFHFGDMVWRLGKFWPEDSVALVYPIPQEWLVEDCMNGDPKRVMIVDKKEAHKLCRRMVRVY